MATNAREDPEPPTPASAAGAVVISFNASRPRNQLDGFRKTSEDAVLEIVNAQP